MNRKVDRTEEPSSQNNTKDIKNPAKVIQVVYIIAALDITWMFLQFSITPVSIPTLAKHEAEISVHAVNVQSRVFVYGNKPN